MTLIELLKHPLLQLPLKRENDFHTFLRKTFDDYYCLLARYEGDLSVELRKRLPEIESLISFLNSSTDNYYLGKTSQAYLEFKKAISFVSQILIGEVPDPTSGTGTVIVSYSHLEQHYFKSRSASEFSLSREQMFIRPFEQREMIPTYRYSIPGLPCLYLSNNVLTTWYELGCPDINTMLVSRFELSAAMKKLNFAWNAKYLTTLLEHSPTFNSDFILNYLSYFPLHAACTVSVTNRNSIFKPEYIFPQFLMQWIRENDIDAIEYMSTQVDYTRLNNDLSKIAFKNIAIPAQTNASFGICTSLRDKIELTNPISWQNLVVSYANSSFPDSQKKEANFPALLNRSLSIELIREKSVLYGTTVFGKLEGYLYNHMEAKHLNGVESIPLSVSVKS